MKTAVEWLVNEFKELKTPRKWNEIIEQAKEMEKQQIIDAYNKAFTYDIIGYDAAKQYYNETFKTK